MRYYLIFLFTLFSCVLIAQKTENTFQVAGNNRIEFAGTLFLPSESTKAVSAMSATLVSRFNCSSSNPNRPNWCLVLELEVARLGEGNDPWWKNMPPIIVLPPLPQPDPLPWEQFSLSELELGASTFFNPRIGLEFVLGDRISLTPSIGGGFRYTAANTTELEGVGTFTTTNSTSPLISFGATARYGISKGLIGKVGFQGITSFEGNLDVIGPDGSQATFAGMSMFIPTLSAGIGININ